MTTIHSLWLSPYQLITLGLALIGVGLTMLWSARPRAAHRPRRAIRQGRRWSRPLACTVVTAAMVTGAQWAVMSWSDARVVWAAALGLPALFVGATVARLLAIAQLVRTVRRGPRYEFSHSPCSGAASMTDNDAVDDTRSGDDGSDGAGLTSAALVLRGAGPVERRTAGEPESARRPVRELTDWAWRSEAVVVARSVAGYRLRHALRDAVRLGWFVIRGHGRWVRKAWTFFTYADLRADARAARVAGDPDRRRTAQELIRADARARWARVGMAVERAGGGALGAGLVGLLLWLVAQVLPREDMWPWLAGLYDVLAWIGHAAARFGPAVLWLTVVGVVVAAAFEGRDRTPGAGWLIHPDRTDADSWVDERMISQALAHLGIAPMDRFFKDGAQLAYTVPARVDGNGTYAQVRLPMGVTAGMVADRRDRLAANLGRAKLETWPTEGGEAGLLDLWVADRGVLGRGAGRWPLLDDGQVDVFDGVPFGRSQRGQLVAAPILERNYVIGGQPGQGKTSAGRTLCLGCVLDPSVELRVFVFAANPDFDPMAPRLARYVKGDDDDAIEAGLTELRWLREEVTRRGRLLERAGAAKVTRSLADRVAGLHPMVVVFDECHELFEHRDYGAEAGGLAVRVVKKARKCGITCSVPDPVTDSPVDPEGSDPQLHWRCRVRGGRSGRQ